MRIYKDWDYDKYGDLTSIYLEHLFDDLFKLKNKFEALGMVIKDSEVYLLDLA